MSRVQEAFQNKKAFIAFVTCGDPDLETTAQIVREMAVSGADLIELGIPFSDPVAEGAVIQSANARALAGGITTDQIFDMVRSLRKDVSIPLVFMTYANIVFSYGTERFLENAAEAGIDGLILPDVPFEEKADFAPACRAHGLDFISLIAPTSADRIAMIAKEAEGFLYCVSSMGVTGVRGQITTNIEDMVRQVRSANSDIPCAVGFGISTPEQAREMAQYADGVIVGSAIVRLVEQHKKDAAAVVGSYVREMKQAMLEPDGR